MEDAGIGVEAPGQAAAHGAIGLQSYPQWFHSKPTNPGRPYPEFIEDPGVSRERLQTLYRMVRLPEPDPGRRIAEDELSVMWQLVDLVDALVNVDLLRRALASYASAASLAAERTIGLYGEYVDEIAADKDEGGAGPPRPSPGVVEAPLPPVLPSARLAGRRRLESAIDSFSVVDTERLPGGEGIPAPAPSEEPNAVVFVDITGYRAIAQREGDRSSPSWEQGLAIWLLTSPTAMGPIGQAPRRRSHAPLPPVGAAVDAAIDLVEWAEAAGMPPRHIGINAGPMVYRDGDYYGHTADTASRLAAAAQAGEIHATRDVVSRVDGRPFDDVGPMPLKGRSAGGGVLAP